MFAFYFLFLFFTSLKLSFKLVAYKLAHMEWLQVED